MSRRTCPVCGAQNPSEAKVCAICGTRLTAQPTSDAPTTSPASGFYDPAAGEDDLLLSNALESRWLSGLLIALGIGIAILVLWMTIRNEDTTSTSAITETTSATFTSTSASPSTQMVNPPMVATATVMGIFAPNQQDGVTPTIPPTIMRATMNFPTVTPTASPQPTEGPCEMTIADGDTLYGLALLCGHVDLSIVDVIVDENNLSCDSCISIGQSITIPRPTPTPNPEPIDTGGGESSNAAEIGGGSELAVADVSELSADDLLATRAVQIEPTLDSNLMFHTILKDQTLYDIIAIYDIDVKILSEINPEVDFPQCDFGETFGGQTCYVFFREGQRIRVPAPTPTPTLRPTLSGSETPTPSATPTVNIPSIFSPENGTQFDATQIISLRWLTTGTLGTDEVYTVRVTNIDTAQTYIGLTCDLSFSLPANWQPEGGRNQRYEWSVSVARITTDLAPQNITYTVRNVGLEMCDFSFTLPIAWQTPDQGTVTISLTDERYATSPRDFLWQGGG